MQKIIRYAAGGLGAVALLTAIGGGAALAQSGGESLIPTFVAARADTPPPEPSHSFLAIGGQDDDYLKRLAAKLGIDEPKLTQAMKDVAKEELDQAVKDGKIAKEMADKIKTAIDSGKDSPFGPGIFPGIFPGKILPFGGAGPDPFGPPLPGFAPKFREQEVAQFLGLTDDQLTAELNSDKTPAEIAAGHGKSRAELKTFLLAERNDSVQKAIDAGKISAEQATKLRAGIDREVESYLDAHIHLAFGKDSKDGKAQPPKQGVSSFFFH